MRWLLVADGRSIHTTRLAAALANAGVEVHLACFDADDIEGITVHRLPMARAGDVRYFLAARSLRRLVRQLHPDVVNAHYLSSYGLLGALAHSSNLVQTVWGTDVLVTAARRGRRELARFALRRARLVTGDSQSLLDCVAELAPHVPRHRFVFGPPLSAFRADAQKDRIVISLRSHEPSYRVDRIVEAWALAQPRLEGYRLVVLGDGPQTSRLRAVASGAVHFEGRVTYERVLDLVSRSRLSVSIPDSDATSAAVLESLACGCSVIATDLPANREWVPEDHLVPIDPDPGELAEAIVRNVERPLSLGPEWCLERQVERLVAAASPTV